MRTETEMGVMHLQSKKCQVTLRITNSCQMLGETKKELLLDFGGSNALLTP